MLSQRHFRRFAQRFAKEQSRYSVKIPWHGWRVLGEFCAVLRNIAPESEQAPARFMAVPDDKLFGDLVTELIARARANSRRVQAFGEMVAPLWAGDEQAATIRLEYPWHPICKRQNFLCSMRIQDRIRPDLPRRIDKPNLCSTL
jgi:hypothetical protein